MTTVIYKSIDQKRKLIPRKLKKNLEFRKCATHQ